LAATGRRLIARRNALGTPERDYFAGGTVQMVSVQNDVVRPREGGAACERHAELPGDAGGVRRPQVADRRRHDGHRGTRRGDGDFSVPRFRACMCGSPVGALRASIGAKTSEAELDRLLDLVTELTQTVKRPAAASSTRKSMLPRELR
jgi:hypothetical protein